MPKKLSFSSDQIDLSPVENEQFVNFLNKTTGITLDAKVEILRLLRGRNPEKPELAEKGLAELPSVILQENLSSEQKEVLLNCVSKCNFQLKIALNEYQLPSQQHLNKVLTSACTDEFRKAKIEKIIDTYYHWKNGKNTMAIAKLQNITRIFQTNDIYDILENQIEYLSYHEKYNEQEFETCALTGVRIKNYRVIRDKKHNATFLVGENIDTLYHDFGVNIPVDVQNIKENFLAKLEEAKEEEETQAFEKVFSSSPETKDILKEAEEILKKANQQLETGIFEQLKTLHERLEKNPDTSIALRALRGKGSYFKRFVEQGNQQKLPTYISSLVEKVSDRRGILSSAEYFILFEYYAKNYLIPQESITPLIENINYFADKQEVNILPVQDLLKKQHLTLFEITKILDIYPELFSRTQEVNKQQLEAATTQHVDIHTVLKEVYPIYLQDRGVWNQSFREQNFLFARALTNQQYLFIKKMLKRWTFGMGNLDLDYNKDILEQTMTRTESIPKFGTILHDFILLYKQLNYARNKKPLSEPETTNISLEKYTPELKQEETNMLATLLENNSSAIIKGNYLLVEEVEEQIGKNLPELILQFQKTYATNVYLQKFITEDLPKIVEASKFGIFPKDILEKLKSNNERLAEYLPATNVRIAAKIKKIKDILGKKWIVNISASPIQLETLETYSYFREKDIEDVRKKLVTVEKNNKHYAPKNEQELSIKIDLLKKYHGKQLIIARGGTTSSLDFSLMPLDMEGVTQKKSDITYYDTYKVDATYKKLSTLVNLSLPENTQIFSEFCALLKQKDFANIALNFGMIVDQKLIDVCTHWTKDSDVLQLSGEVFAIIQKAVLLVNQGLNNISEEDRFFVAAARRKKYKKETPSAFDQFYQEQKKEIIHEIQKAPLLAACINGISAGFYKKGGIFQRFSKYAIDDNYIEKNLASFLEKNSSLKDFFAGEFMKYEIPQEYKKNLKSDYDTGRITNNQYTVYLQLLDDFEGTINEKYISSKIK